MNQKKVIVLEEETRVLLNRVKGAILRHTPEIKKLTDDLAVRKALEFMRQYQKYVLRGQNARPKK